MMRSVVVVLMLALITFSSNGGEAVFLRYDFNEWEIVEVKIVDTVTDFPKPDVEVDKKEYRVSFECRTEDVEIKDGFEEAVKVFKFTEFSLKHFKDGEEVEVDEKIQKSFNRQKYEFLRLSLHLLQTSSGRLSLNENKRAYLYKWFVGDFGRYISVVLPDGPVRVGVKWKNPYSRSLEENEHGYQIDVDEYEYVGNEEIDGVLCARIVGENHGILSKLPRRDPPKPLEKKNKPAIIHLPSISVVVFFDIEKGRIIRQEITRKHTTDERRDMLELPPVSIKEVVTYCYREAIDVLTDEFLNGERVEWRKALEELERRKEIKIITKGLQHVSFEARFAVVESLARLDDETALPYIVEALKSENLTTETATDKFLPRNRFKAKLVDLIERLSGEKFEISDYDDMKQVGDAVKRMEQLVGTEQ